MPITFHVSNKGCVRYLIKYYRHFWMTWDASEKQLAVGGADRTVRLLNTETGSQQVNARHYFDWFNDVAFSQEGKRVVSAS